MTCGCNDKCELPKALQINNPGEVTLFHRVDIPASQGDDTTYPPKNGLYRNVLLVYLANNHSYLYNSDGIPTRVDGPAGPGTAAGGETGQILAKRSDADYDTTWITQTSANDATLTISRNDTPVGTFTANASVDKTIDIEVPTKTSDLENDGATGESTYAEATDINAIWEEIEEIEAASDVTDVVGTYAELEAYDTSKLKDNDIIKVLEDETHDDQITYYRWDTDTETFTLIGAIGPYYTKSEADTTFQGKLTAGSNITIDANNEISATDTTYSDFTGATSSVAGSHGLVPAPTTSDPDKFLKGDGTWGTPPGTTYSEGTGIDITGSTISVDTSTVAMQSDLPTRTSDLINDGADNTSTYVEADELATVATSGSYNDLLNKPTIPTVNDATLTIQKNGTTVETFTANSSSNKTANITVPTKTSDLTNDGSDSTSTYVEADELQPSYIEGEGTSITFPSTQGAQFKDTKLKGNSDQSGSNVLTLVQTDNPKGLTVTANTTTNTITYGGTTNDGYPWINGATGTDMPMSAGTFIISIDKALTYDLGFRFYNSSGQFPTSTSIAAGSKTVTVAVGYAIKKVVTLLSVASGVTIPNTTIKLTMTPTSPTPAYPITVQSVTGEQTITITGKNLCDGVSQDYWLNQAADNAGVTTGNSGLIIKVDQNTDYTISTTATQARYRAAFSDTDWQGSQFACYNGQSKDGQDISFTINSGSHSYLVLNATDLTKIQIEKGSTATAFEPYKEQEYTINLNKNLFDKLFTLDGYFINAGAQTIGQGSGYAVVYIPCQPSTTYTISKIVTSRFTVATTTATPANGVNTSSTTEAPTQTTMTYTTSNNANYLVIMVRSSSDTATTQQIVDSIQIEQGSTATAYTPHIELCKIGDYQDYIYKSSGTWYLHKETGKIVDNGASGWGTSGAPVASGVSAYVHTGLNIPDYTTGYVNMATLRTSWSDWTTGDGLQSGAAAFISNNYYFKISTSIASTVAQLQSFLESNPLITYYALATATDTQITGSIATQLNALAAATGYSGTTIITASVPSPDLPAILSLSTALPSALPLATTTSAGSVSVGDGLLVDGNGRLSVDKTIDPTVYSTDETRIGTWIDGKPLYRKVINFGALPNATTKSVAHGLLNFRVRNFYGAAVNPTNGTTFYLPTLSGSTSAFVTMYIDSSNVIIDAMSTNRSAFTECYITIEYTKTTD